MSDRCTVWITVRKSDITNPPDEVRELLDESTDSPSDESDTMLEFTFEEIRYPDDLCGPLIEAKIPYKSVNSAGEYPEAACIFDGKKHYLVTLLYGDIVCKIDNVTLEPYAHSLKQARDYLEAKKWFEQYLRTGEERRHV